MGAHTGIVSELATVVSDNEASALCGLGSLVETFGKYRNEDREGMRFNVLIEDAPCELSDVIVDIPKATLGFDDRWPEVLQIPVARATDDRKHGRLRLNLYASS